MKLGIVGPPQAGKSAIFTILSGETPDASAAAGKTVNRIVPVQDRRLEHLREVHDPRSFKPATFMATDFGIALSKEQRIGDERNADAFIVVLPAFGDHDPRAALSDLDTDWTLLDMRSCEVRLEKLGVKIKRPIPQAERDVLEAERVLLERVLAWVSEERPLRDMQLEPKERKILSPFAFFTLKPRLLVLNVGEEALPYREEAAAELGVPEGIPVSAAIEAELTLMEAEERAVFMEEYAIVTLARERLAHAAYHLLGLHSFFTVGPDEVRAWTVRVGASAWEAAGAVHSDIKRGFIRAEVVAYEDYKASGSDMKRAKALHHVRLEGRDYAVCDGDIIEFRFNV